MNTMARSLRSLPPEQVVGREDQLTRLQGLLDEVTTDGSRFVLIGGDAGSGKTTVVQSFAGRLRRSLADRKAQLICGQCVPLGGDGLPYAPVAGALRELLEAHGRERVLDWAGAGRSALGIVLPDLISAPRDAESIRLQLFEAVARLCERASEQGPLVLVIEDIHWADESTRHLLRFLVRALTDAAVLVIATYRTDELTRRHPLRPFLAEVGRISSVVRLDVPSLSKSEVGELLATLLHHRPSPVVTELVHRRSEGVPYFVAELATSAARGCIDMPDTLRDALSVRISLLSDAAVDTLRIAATAGNRVDHPLLEAVSPGSPTELESDLREAVDAAVLVADDTGYAFRHALLREVVDEDMLPGQRARLHARFAQVLEQSPELAGDAAALQIAHHWFTAHDVGKAFRWSIAAADSGSAAHVETLKTYERALELWDQVPEAETIAGAHVGVLDKAVRAACDAGEVDRALVLASAALAETGEDDVMGRIQRLAEIGSLRCNLMRPGSVEAVEEAMALLPPEAPSRFRAMIMEQVARIRQLAGLDATADARIAVAAAVQSGSDVVEANARVTLGTGLVMRGQEAEGMAEFQRAGELAQGSPRTLTRYYINYSDALTNTGRYEAAITEALEGIDVARHLGLERSVGSMLAGNAAEPMLALGEWDRADRMITRALELDPPAHHFIHSRLLLAWLSVWRGDLEGADSILTEWRGLVTEAPAAPQYVGLIAWIDGELALATGDVERAWRHGDAAIGQIGRFASATALPMLRVAAAGAFAMDQQPGVADRAASQADDGGDASDRRDRVRAGLALVADSAMAPVWRPVIEAELSDDPAAWRAVWSPDQEHPGPAHLRPYAGLRLAQHLIAQRERVEARQVLTEAADLAEQIGAALLSERLAALSQRAGLGHATRSETEALASLTPRELEVLELVAAGRSNGDIGAALFISTKTASVHVSNILAKLGVASRGEAAAFAYRAGRAEDTADVIQLRPA